MIDLSLLVVIAKTPRRKAPMPQTPDSMFADKGYDGWENLSPREKVERMMEIHKSGHEGEDVS